MLRKLLGACVGLAIMGMAGTASAALIIDNQAPDGDNTGITAFGEDRINPGNPGGSA